MLMGIESSNCDWCGTAQVEFLFDGPDLLTNLSGTFRMVRCAKCGLIRQDPYLNWESLRSFYPEDYRAYDSVIDNEVSVLRRLQRRYGMWKRLRLIEHYRDRGRLLDVGCGTGVFLAEARRSGRWDVVGVEPNQAAANYVQGVLKVPIIQKPFSEANLPEDSFDVITMWNVLEHFYHPIDELRSARKLLRDGGWLIFSIPNLEGWEARAFGSAWLGWDLPRHLYIFPREQMRAILSEIGFNVADMKCLAGGHAAFGLTLEFWNKARGFRQSLVNRMLMQTYYSVPVQILLGIPFWILGELRLGGLITIVAQKVQMDK